jgi:hypothetical protein
MKFNLNEVRYKGHSLFSRIVGHQNNDKMKLAVTVAVLKAQPLQKTNTSEAE